MFRFSLGLCTVATLVVGCPNLAHATESADSLYRRGVEEFRAGRYDAACRALAESHRLEPLLGVLFTLATCEARAGRPATAVVYFDHFLNLVSKSAEAEKSAQKQRTRVAELERERALSRVAHLRILPSEAWPSGARVTLNGRELAGSELARSQRLDPGEQELVVTLEDGSRLEQRVVLTEGEQREQVLHLPSRAASRRAASESHRSPWWYVAGATTGAGLATGVVTGLLALERKSFVDETCRGAACSEAGKVAADTARTEALASTIAFGVAGVGALALVGLVVWDRPEPRAHASRVELGVTPSGALLRGTF